MQLDEWKQFFIQMWLNTINPVIERLNQNIIESIENYKKLGEEVQVQEVQKIREILTNTAQTIEQLLRVLDVKLAEFLIEAQKNLETIFEQIQSLLKSEDLKTIQETWDGFTKYLLNQTPESIIRQILDNFSKSNPTYDRKDSNEEINIIFSESDTNIPKKD